MENTHELLCSFLGISLTEVVSRSHLPILLKKVNVLEFDNLLFKNYGIELSNKEKAWFSGDGKDLRGSIQSGDTRGQAVVQLVRHQDHLTLCQNTYNGSKESEKPCIQELLEESSAKTQKVTLDALHLSPKTTELINQAGGIFQISLKANQEELLEDMKVVPKYIFPSEELSTLDKGHGRVDQRFYQAFDVSKEYFDDRWDNSGFKTLIKVKRTRFYIKTQKEIQETAYYISNGPINMAQDLFKANKNHWGIESNNAIRDVTLKEDKLKTKIDEVSLTMASLRTLSLNLIRRIKTKNIKAKIEYFQDNTLELLKWLRQIKFL